MFWKCLLFHWLSDLKSNVLGGFCQLIQVDLFLDHSILLNLHFAKCASCWINYKIWVSWNELWGLGLFFKKGPGSLQSVFGSDRKYWSPRMKTALGLDHVAGFPHQFSPIKNKTALPIPAVDFTKAAQLCCFLRDTRVWNFLWHLWQWKKSPPADKSFLYLPRVFHSQAHFVPVSRYSEHKHFARRSDIQSFE